MSGMRVDFPAEGTILRVGGEAGASLPTGETPAVEGPTFESVLEKTVEAANVQDKVASAKAEALAAGRLDDLHGTMIAMKEADISMKLVGTVRNKLLDAFHELWRTSV